jgi:hypothetical protein
LAAPDQSANTAPADRPPLPLDDAADLRGVAPSLSRFTRMIDAQHHQTLAIEAILKHVSRAENLQYDLAIFFPASNRPTELRMF